MFKDDFVKYFFFLCLIILLLYIFQPSFWNKHPGLVKFFDPGYSAPAPRSAATDSSGAKLSPVPLKSSYARIAGVSLSSTGEEQELRILAAANSPSAVDVSGWQIKTSLKKITLPAATRVSPGEILTISSKTSSVSGSAQKTLYLGQRFLGLSDTVYLYSGTGVLVDKYAY